MLVSQMVGPHHFAVQVPFGHQCYYSVFFEFGILKKLLPLLTQIYFCSSCELKIESVNRFSDLFRKFMTNAMEKLNRTEMQVEKIKSIILQPFFTLIQIH